MIFGQSFSSALSLIGDGMKGFHCMGMARTLKARAHSYVFGSKPNAFQTLISRFPRGRELQAISCGICHLQSARASL